MNRILNSIICLTLCLTFMGKVSHISPEEYLSSHLNEFSSINQAHHDNIDDDNVPHVHRHKHSEDGEEHEHDHYHTVSSQVEVKLAVKSFLIQFNAIELACNHGYAYKHLISSPYPMDILRPPIS